MMTDFVALRPKAYSSLVDDGDKNKKAKRTKQCVVGKNGEIIVQILKKTQIFAYFFLSLKESTSDRVLSDVSR